MLFFHEALDSHPLFRSHVASGRCILSAAAAGAPAGVAHTITPPTPGPGHDSSFLEGGAGGGGGRGPTARNLFQTLKQALMFAFLWVGHMFGTSISRKFGTSEEVLAVLDPKFGYFFLCVFRIL